MSAGENVIRISDWQSLRRVVYYDPVYPRSWIREPAELARVFAEAGYAPLDARQLGAWLRAHVSDGAGGSVCVFAQDILPDTAAEDCSPDCLLLRYLRAGGRAVWLGDVPFYYQGRPGGGRVVWQQRGQKAALGLDSVWDLKEPVQVTAEGAQWGLTAPDKAMRCVPLPQVTAALTSAGRCAVSFFKNYNEEYPYSGLLRLSETQPPAELLRAALYGIEEPDTEAAAPAGPAPDAAPAEDAELVASGTFTVDRSRALDKLMRFQLPDPETCLLPLARCAGAAGAAEFSVAENYGGSVLARFGGACFSREQLEDPYAPLFEPRTAANAAGRHLATALLCALRLRPRHVTITSGPDRARFRLRVDELGREEVQPSEEPGEGTTFKITWRASIAGLGARSLLRHIGSRCAFSPVRIVLNGRSLPQSRLEDGRDGLLFEEGGLRGWIAPPERPAENSTLTMLVDGVALDNPLLVRLRGLQVRGRLDSPDFTMNISQTGVVNNSRCARALAAVGRRLPELVLKTAAAQETRLPEAGRLALRGGLDGLWREKMGGSSPLLPGLFAGLSRGLRLLLPVETSPGRSRREAAEKAVTSAAAVTVWLQDACARLLGDWETDSADPMLRALWTAPVFLSVSGAALSMRSLQEQRGRLGFVPYSTLGYPESRLPFDAVWCSGYRELALLRRWETVNITAKIPYYGHNRAAAEEFMGSGASGLLALRHDVEITPAAPRPRQAAVEIKLSVPPLQTSPLPPPPPPPAASPRPEPRPFIPPQPPVRPAAPPPPPKPRKKTAPLPDAAALAADPAGKFPEYLARKLNSSVNAPGARLVAQYIRDEGADPRWTGRGLRAAVLASSLPPERKAQYLLSVFYTEYNRREARFTDSDDINFQQALAGLALEETEG